MRTGMWLSSAAESYPFNQDFSLGIFHQNQICVAKKQLNVANYARRPPFVIKL